MKYIFILILLLMPVLVHANSPPVLGSIKTQSLEVGKEFSFIIGSTDPDGDELTFSDDSQLFDVTPIGAIKFIPSENQVGIHEFSVTAFDGEFQTPAKGKLVINKNLTEIRVEPQPVVVNLNSISNITKQVKISNPTKEKIYLVAESKSKNIKVVPENIEIEGNSQKTIDILSSPEGFLETGSFAIYGGKAEKTIPFIATRSSEDSKYGLILSMAGTFGTVGPGEEIVVDVKIDDKQKRTDADIEYIIKDLQNGELKKVSDKLLGTETKTSKKIQLPPFIGEGEYVIGVIVSHNGTVKTQAETFLISKNGKKESQVQYVPSNLQIIVSVIIVILVSILLYLNYGRLTQFDKKKSVQVEQIYQDFLQNKESLEKAQETKRKLEKQLESLEKAYKMKLISEDSYNKGRKRIEEFVKKINKNLK